MIHRPRAIRYLAFMLATLQLAAPGLSAIADGILSREAASTSTTHIEATTRANCPFVHSPDCGVCRYLSQSLAQGRSAISLSWASAAHDGVDPACIYVAKHSTLTLSLGRAPPSV
jgi:hypothetical protein